MGDEHMPAVAHEAHRPDAASGRTAPKRTPGWFGTAGALLTGRAVSLYAAAALRIGYGSLYFVFLLREFPHRDEIWGPGSPWSPDLAAQLFDQTGWVSVLAWSDSQTYFNACYVLALCTSALFALGWRTRAVSVLFATMVASFHAQAIYMTDGGDNLILLMAVYLVLTACGRRWSLDARRARLRSGRPRSAPRSAGVREDCGLWRRLGCARRVVVTALHNCGMAVIAVQVCLLYGSAGLYKVQGGLWGDGTAMHYVLHLELFNPWPEVSRLLDGYQVPIMAVGYLTVLLQVALPFVLFSRLKYPVLTMMLGMHLSIALLMGLPVFSGAMIVADAVFLPDRFYRSLGALARRALRRTVDTGAATPRREADPLLPQQTRLLRPGSAGWRRDAAPASEVARE
jgi:hypothetical protein